MAQSALKWTFNLGSVSLDRFEVPDHFDLGHEINAKVHDFIDEVGQPQRRVHGLGAFAVPTSWKGILYSGDNGDAAVNRAALLDNLSVAQQEIVWQWGPLQYNVFIKKFTWTPHHQNEIEYDIELVVLSNLNGTSGKVSQVLSYDSATTQFYTTAQTAMTNLQQAATTTTLPSSLLAATGNVDTLMANANPLGAQTVETIQALLSGVSFAIGALAAFEEPYESTAVLAEDLALLDLSLQALQGYGLLYLNLSQLIGATPGSQIIQSFTGSLFAIAAQYYPNADPDAAASAVAQANNLIDLFVDSPTDISLPPLFS